MGILYLQRIEGPFDQLNAFADSVITLRKLHAPPEPMVAITLANRQHVRVQVSMSTTRARDGEDETDHVIILLAIKRAQELAANLLTDYEHAHRYQVGVGKTPDFLLQGNAGFDFFDVLAAPNDKSVIARSHGYLLLSSSVLACCHRVSISSRFDSSSFLPRRRSSSSRCPNRRRNLRLVLRRADSGSTDSQRARFTSTKNMSPISSSNFLCISGGI